jgi:hypothetical protein
LLEPTQHLFSRQVLPLKRSPGLGESGPLLLKLAFRLLAGDSLLPELLLRRDDRGGLVGQAGPQLLSLLGSLLDLLGPLLGLALPGPRSLKGCTVPLELGASRHHLCLPLGRHGVRPRQIPPHPPQCLVLVHELCAPPRRRRLPPQAGPPAPGGRRERRAAPGAGGARSSSGRGRRTFPWRGPPIPAASERRPVSTAQM